jgi:hypothetical protein
LRRRTNHSKYKNVTVIKPKFINDAMKNRECAFRGKNEKHMN